MCESFDGKKPLKAVLQESYDAANDEEKQLMKETLDNLNIDVNLTEAAGKTLPGGTPTDPEMIPWAKEDKFEDIPLLYESVEDSSDDSSEDVIVTPAETIGELVKELDVAEKETPVEFKPVETPAGEELEVKALEVSQEDDKVVVEVKVEKDEISPEVTPVDNIEVGSIVKPELEEPVVKSAEATDGGDVELLDSLKEMVRQKDLLESELKEIKSQQTVSDAEVKGLKEELKKYKDAYIRVSELASKATKFEKENKALVESVAQKDAQIAELSKNVENNTRLTESVNAHANKVSELTEKLHAAVDDAEKSEKALKEEIATYRKKLAKRTDTAKAYKAKYETVLEHYVETKAKMLGVRTQDITSRLVENYSTDDIDKVCDDLLTESFGWSNLPYGMSRGQAKIQVKESGSSKPASSDGGYEIDDDLLELAGLK